jgi:hypothetical protein
MVSVEFETSYRDPKQYELYRWGYIPTYDGSIGGVEWKSPIYTSWQSIWAACRWALHPLRNLVGDDAGTHIHVSASYRARDYLGNYWEQVLEPLVAYMVAKKLETIEIWGRYFNDYTLLSRRPDEEDDYESNLHHLWVSPYSRYPTIEFRLPRFRDYQQFYRLIKYCVEVVRLLGERPRGSKILEHYKNFFKEVVA